MQGCANMLEEKESPLNFCQPLWKKTGKANRNKLEKLINHNIRVFIQ